MSAISPLATITWKDLKEGKRLGQGAYGVVHLGQWQGQIVAIGLTSKKCARVICGIKPRAFGGNYWHIQYA